MAQRKYTTPAPVVYPADLVWAAACAAQRVNGEYVKRGQQSEKKINRDLMLEFMNQPSTVTEEDFTNGAEVRRYYNSLTFKIVQGEEISDFDNSALKIAQLDNIFSMYDIALVASLPAACERGRARDQVNKRLSWETSGFVGKVGDKVTLALEVVKCNFSQNWGIYYVTGITTDNKAVFFGYRSQVAVGSTITAKGTVKAHRDNSTQLNRVKVQ